MTGKILEYYNYIRPRVAEWAGIPEANVFVFGNQSLNDRIDEAIANLQVGIVINTVSMKSTAGTGPHTKQPIAALTFAVDVCTPGVLLDSTGVPVHDIAEGIICGLHGHKPTGGAAGMMQVAEFLTMENKPPMKTVAGEPMFVMSIEFECRMRLNKTPVTESD